MISTIKKILESKNVEYLINERKESSYELFFVNNELQMNRAKDVHHFDVVVYVTHGNFKGSATLKIHPTMNEAEVEAAIDEGIYAASFINNKPFELAKPVENLDIIQQSNMVGKDMEELAISIAEAVLKADKQGGILNATEVFVYDRTLDIYNSNGIHYTKSNVSGEVEFITTQAGAEEEVELYNFKSINELNLDEITKAVEDALKDTKLRAIAKPMPSLEKINVVFRSEEIGQLMGVYGQKTNVQAIYSRASNTKVGDNLQGENITGDKVTIIIDPLLKSSPRVSPFDQSGYPNHKTTIVENGVAKAVWGDNVFGQYIGVETTVNSRNMVLLPGTLTDEEMNKEDYLDIVKMSGIQVDATTGSFGGEIRLAMLHKDGQVTPVFGGSISGFLKDYSQTLRLSCEVINDEDYQGPKFLMIKNATILGK